MPMCKEISCTTAVRLVPDKEQEAVRWSGSRPNEFLIYLYPSKVCDSGLCNYHWLKRYYGRLWEIREQQIALEAMKRR